MPTYEYRCKKCGKTFEKLQSMSASPVKTCPKPKCGGRVERLIGGGAGIIFKGSGFYQTDYKKTKTGDGGQKTAASDKKSETKPKECPAKRDCKGGKCPSE